MNLLLTHLASGLSWCQTQVPAEPAIRLSGSPGLDLWELTCPGLTTPSWRAQVLLQDGEEGARLTHLFLIPASGETIRVRSLFEATDHPFPTFEATPGRIKASYLPAPGAFYEF